jgi:hypothetical protein
MPLNFSPKNWKWKKEILCRGWRGHSGLYAGRTNEKFM